MEHRKMLMTSRRLKRLPAHENRRLKTAIFIKIGEYVQKTLKSPNKIKGV
jgi:hypothetical protein